MTKRLALFIAAAPALAAVTLPAARAEAQERKSPLADAPAIRHRVELRDKRFELGAGISTTLGQDFYHAVLVGGRIGFHLTDWLSIAGTAGYNVTPDFATAFHDKVTGALPDARGEDRTPSRTEALDGMNRINTVFGGQLEIVPFTGKFALFSKLFMNYDFYFFGGPGFINFKADGACAAGGSTCPVTGMKIGGNFGAGMHAYGNDWFAINLELRDILVRNNPAGRDATGDGVVDDSDLSWDSNYMFSLNLMLFLPTTASISD